MFKKRNTKNVLNLFIDLYSYEKITTYYYFFSHWKRFFFCSYYPNSIPTVIIKYLTYFRVPSIPSTELQGHTAPINSIAWHYIRRFIYVLQVMIIKH